MPGTHKYEYAGYETRPSLSRTMMSTNYETEPRLAYICRQQIKFTAHIIRQSYHRAIQELTFPGDCGKKLDDGMPRLILQAYAENSTLTHKQFHRTARPANLNPDIPAVG